MSKSKRAKENRSAELARQLESKANEQKEIRRQNIIGVLAVLCGLIVIALVYFSVSFYNNGTLMRKSIALESENYKINNCMFSYYIYENYRDFISINYEDLDNVYKLNNKKSLKKQSCTLADGSWYDYFSNQSKTELEELLLYAEAAIDLGLKLDDSDKKAVERRIEKLEQDAELQNYKSNDYYEFLYGRGVKEQDLRDCFMLEALADKYKKSAIDTSFSFTEAELNDAYNADPKKYSVIDYLYLTITADYDKNADEATKKDAIAKAAAWAEKFKAISGTKAFKDLAEDYAYDRYDVGDDSSGLINLLDMVFYESMTDEAYSNTDFGNAAFNNNVAEGQIIVINNDNEYKVYCITNPMHKPTYSTKNIGLIDLSGQSFGSIDNAKTFANRALETYKENPSDETFADLAVAYCKDYNLAKMGGALNNVSKHELDALVDEWIFYEGRKKDDITILQSFDCVYLVRYLGDGYVAWQSDIIEGLRAEFEANQLKELKEQHEITVNEKQLTKISL